MKLWRRNWASVLQHSTIGKGNLAKLDETPTSLIRLAASNNMHRLRKLCDALAQGGAHLLVP
uniref:ANK_REP_REGION domain-containing protein n=1 Tax=Globodera pallida TaxID=36090 RepID=A0A183CQQ9_GLOPA